jgi:dTDP-4-dehydrorhamnose 3,5-epimerase
LDIGLDAEDGVGYNKGNTMNIKATAISDVYILEQDVHKDIRGSFVKTFQRGFFTALGLECDFVESYYTRSREDVIRGMHFQTPNQDHAKLVTVIQGTIIDVILDIRRLSPTYGQHVEIELSRENRRSIYIPRGCAHGFGTLSDTAIAYYMVTSEYAPTHDAGIHYASFGYCWPIANPIVSERDRAHPRLSDYTTPF